ncbi:ubiquitin carboxyl-terminal hydrolase-related protein [Actinidia rufa]|uniref:Ubiquitin carboxyl-terminal hydrolase-related protein n=1 Tax=Actinidia rufa TaxID=165716 RepID=A0A7J0F2L5_9ERIC|nr:ubiquitin carboxyl-terminal hydrolase-related protein [Actinidia rufa]
MMIGEPKTISTNWTLDRHCNPEQKEQLATEGGYLSNLDARMMRSLTGVAVGISRATNFLPITRLLVTMSLCFTMRLQKRSPLQFHPMAFVQILKLLYLYIGMSQTLDIKLNLKLRKEGLKKLWSIRDESKMRLNRKYLAERHKKAKRTIPEKHSDDDQDVHRQLNHCKQLGIMVLSILEPLTQKNGFPNGLEGVPVNTTDKAAQMTGLAIDIPEDGVLFNWQTGRKGIRQKSSAKLIETNYQS